MKAAVWRWGPVLGCMAAIFYESSQPYVPNLPAGLSNHTGHFIAYAVLAVATLRAMAGVGSTGGVRWAGVTIGTAAGALLFASAYGVTDEFHQRFVANRFSGADDWLADTLGAFVAVAVALAFARWRERKDL